LTIEDVAEARRAHVRGRDVRRLLLLERIGKQG
jgi:hypothetical protein